MEPDRADTFMLMIKQMPSVRAMILYVGFATVVIAAKYFLIAHYGNATPFWDQWDSEADRLYRPWLEGTLVWTEFFSAHNEHRILTSRLLALGLLEFNGRIWDPILQMQVNAVLHVTALSVLLSYLSKALSDGHKSALFVFTGVLFAIPFGWENTLAGFNAPFYFLLLFSFPFLWAMSTYKTYSAKWWAGIMCGALCVLSLASGAISILAGSLILAFRRFVVKDKGGVAVTAILLLLLLAVVAISMTPSVPHHATLKAQSALQFVHAFATALSWPIHKAGIGFLVIQAPILLFGVLVLCKSDCRTPPFLFIVAMTLWLFGQFVSISYGRALQPTASRYQDLFAIGLVLNVAAIIVLFSRAGAQHRLRYGVGAAIWSATVVLGFIMSLERLSGDLDFRARSGLEQEKNVRAYLCTGDIIHLQNKPRLYLPYPNPDRLKDLLDNPTIRGILPGNIYGPNSKNPIGPDGEPFCDPGSLARAYDVWEWDNLDDRSRFATNASVKSNGWLGTDYFRSTIPGFQVVGSFINSENDTGLITLHLRRGERLLYRSGPRVAGQSLLINNGGAGKFFTALPLAMEWTVLEFSSAALPEEFDVTFVDTGTKWAEWSAIALLYREDP